MILTGENMHSVFNNTFGSSGPFGGQNQTNNSNSLENIKLPKMPVALIFGNEVNGVSQEVINLSKESVEIPQLGTKHSLNVSVAAGIVIWKYYEILKNQNR